MITGGPSPPVRKEIAHEGTKCVVARRSAKIPQRRIISRAAGSHQVLSRVAGLVCTMDKVGWDWGERPRYRVTSRRRKS